MHEPQPAMTWRPGPWTSCGPCSHRPTDTGVRSPSPRRRCQIILHPPQAPERNAICERLIGTLRREAPDRILILEQTISDESSPSTPSTTTDIVPTRLANQCPPDADPAKPDTPRRPDRNPSGSNENPYSAASSTSTKQRRSTSKAPGQRPDLFFEHAQARVTSGLPW